MHNNKVIRFFFGSLLFLTLLTPFMVYKDLLFPFVTSKAFYLRIVVELALPFYIYLLVVRPQARPNLKNPLTMAVIVFWVINLVTSFFGVNIIKSLWGNFERMGGTYYVLHLTLVYFYLLALAKLDNRTFQYFLKATVWVASFLSVYGIFTAMGMKPIVTDPSLPRISIFFGNPIYVGSFMILPMFLAAFFARQAETPGGRVWYWVLAILQLLAMYLSGTRGAIVGIILGLFLAGVMYVVFVGSSKMRLWSGLILVCFSLVAVTLYMNNSKLPQGSTLRRIFSLQDSNTESRFIQWRMAWQGAKEYWYMGTGPENYYLVANKYHNPEIMKYDPSWFDKPHNFLLEVLVTTGIFGFLAYAAIFIFSVYGAYRAFKAGFLELLEFLILVTGIVAYQIQNLFVFDNVSGSLMFFAYTALCAYLWQEGEKLAASEQSAAQKKFIMPNSELGYAILGVASLVVAYGVYASNILPMQAAAGVNYGYAYSSVDPKKSLAFFEESVNTPFNFDFGETTSRFAELALGAAYNQNIPKEQAIEIIDKSISALKDTVARVNNNPIYYQRLANLVLVRDSVTGKPFSQEGQDYLNRAIELAPRRTEARMLKAQVLVLGGRKEDGVELAKQAMQDAPGSLNIQWQYASMLKQAGKEAEAVTVGEDAVSKGYAFRSWKDAVWLVDAYRKNKQYDKAVAIFVKLNDSKLLDAEGYWALAQIYAEAGDKVHAADIAKKLAENEPKYKARAEEFLKKLGQ